MHQNILLEFNLYFSETASQAVENILEAIYILMVIN